MGFFLFYDKAGKKNIFMSLSCFPCPTSMCTETLVQGKHFSGNNLIKIDPCPYY